MNAARHFRTIDIVLAVHSASDHYGWFTSLYSLNCTYDKFSVESNLLRSLILLKSHSASVRGLIQRRSSSTIFSHDEIF